MKSASTDNRRLFASGSLTLIAAYAAAAGFEAFGSGVAFDDVQIFPLGSESDASFIGRGLALTLGLLLGWGVPGFSLALLLRTAPAQPMAMLGRAFGLGFGYILVTSVGYALIAGHAPHRAVFLILLSAPSVIAMWPEKTPGQSDRRLVVTFGAALLTMAAITAVLWPHLRIASLNGDGTEVYELARSLEAHPFPRWDLEAGDDGKFGIPVVAPYVTGAYFTAGELTILGRGELAVRMPFVIALIIVAATGISLLRTRSWFSWLYVAAVVAVFALWHTYYATYERPFPEIAAAAGSDTLTIALWLAGFGELMHGSAWLGAAFMAFASGVRYSAAVLTVLALVAVWLTNRVIGRAFVRSAIAAGICAVAAVALLGWASGDWDQWVRQVREEYLEDYAGASDAGASWLLLRSLALMTGALPVVAIIGWCRLSASSRALLLTGLAYLGVVLAGGEKHLHYLTPLPWIFLPAAVEAATVRWRWSIGAATAVLAVTFALSWPDVRAARTENAQLGRESCVQGFDYETASLHSVGIYSALDQPPRAERFAVGKHTFVRYAMDLGGRDCVVGLSPTPPQGAILLVDRPAPIWTTDPDRYAAWRFRRVAAPVSALFPFDTPEPLPVRAADWRGRLDLSRGRSQALVVSVSQEDSGDRLMRARLLAPVTRADAGLVVGLHAGAAGSASVSTNGGPPVAIALAAGEQAIAVQRGIRMGWNILTIESGRDVTIRWLEGR